MTREEASFYLANMDRKYMEEGMSEALDMAIQALEQDTVPFDFELYQAGLMDMPNEMIKVLDKIRAEMEQIKEAEYQIYGNGSWRFVDKCLDIINKYKEESEDNNGKDT